jgi:hypothetical protein
MVYQFGLFDSKYFLQKYRLDFKKSTIKKYGLDF